MGVDCPDICNVIHYGPPKCIEQYVQETGRAGRNGICATALLLYGKPGKKHLQKTMVDYSTNSTQCHRAILFKDFLFYKDSEFTLSQCKCCDICEKKCKCTDCI